MLSWCFGMLESLVIGTYFLKERPPRSVFLKARVNGA
jgi:hypothetical protein